MSSRIGARIPWRGTRKRLTPAHRGDPQALQPRDPHARASAYAVVLGGLAVAEFGAWLGLQGVSLMAVTAGVLALSVAAVAAAALVIEAGRVAWTGPAARAPAACYAGGCDGRRALTCAGTPRAPGRRPAAAKGRG